ncbi:MAG: transketolase [Omnitrophica WOR_2 bacterium GWF2_43_52]|nr:MAG: transketolase [Omnitrophica WOR_2 bacterium GWC2_44_8]OGX20823.1 MAG: transketolase [Omnitrophica WOR_2 bacterium GWF2_43_52]HAH19854.1 transketolase [Candidatus Omnitrophota bacterium]HBG63478.1 transketolase [Candidatus Omnitrophota bacterium]
MEFLYQRDVYGKTLVELGKKDPNVVVFDADLSSSTRTCIFRKEFKNRFFNFGVAEQNMIAASAGMASCGKIVFVSTFAIFATGRAWDQVRNTVAYNNFNIKIVATHAGVSVGPDGASHQALEDITLMRLIPYMKVIAPCDGPQTHDAVVAAYETPGPVYVRLGRPKVPTIEGRGAFRFGEAEVLTQGKDLTIIACGIMVKQALDAASALKKEGVTCRVINMHTIKPIDTKAIIKAANETKGIVVCEEHTIVGGLASAVDEVAAENKPTTVLRVGVRNRYGQSGEPEELLNEYKLSVNDIILTCKKVL